MQTLDLNAEWLETDGLGGFATGSVSGVLRRRYHSLLVTAEKSINQRYCLLNNLQTFVETPKGMFALSSNLFEPGVMTPDGMFRIESFQYQPWPRWKFRIDERTCIYQEIFMPKGYSTVIVSWQIDSKRAGTRLIVKPLISSRSMHALHQSNPSFDFEYKNTVDGIVVDPYKGNPPIQFSSNAEVEFNDEWFYQFKYEQDRERGYDCLEDLASPAVFNWNISSAETAYLACGTTQAIEQLRNDQQKNTKSINANLDFAQIKKREQRRREAFSSNLAKSADSYLVSGQDKKTIIAGYPWFGDWGRDTFIAMRGLTLANSRFDDAENILISWAEKLSQGMLPNRFLENTDSENSPEYNSVDASLWFVIVVYDFLRLKRAGWKKVLFKTPQVLMHACEQIVDAYIEGTRHNIKCDSTDGLLFCGQTGFQLTWMDAKVGAQVVTPRIGKPVEIQALWLNALRICAGFGLKNSKRAKVIYDLALKSFNHKFWNAERGCLYDVVDHDFKSGVNDPSMRPNQIFAVGGLPFVLIEPLRARKVVNAVERHLYTKVGLRTLASFEAEYKAWYQGTIQQRDAAYHQGTVWPWLLGPFIEAWVRVRDNSVDAKRDARMRFFEPLIQSLDEAGLGHISEIADGDFPHTFRGCPFQAWSLGEALRLDLQVLD